MPEKSDGYIEIKYPIPIKGTKGYWEDSVVFTQIGIFERRHAIEAAILRDSTSLAQVRANIMMIIERMENEVKNQEISDIYGDEWIKLKDMLSILQTQNGFLFNPEVEKRIIILLNNPRRLRAKFRSKAIDKLIGK